MADGDLGPHRVEQVVEIRAVLHVLQQPPYISRTSCQLRRACSARRGIALVAPAFGEDLRNSSFGSRYIRSVADQLALPCACGAFVGIDEEQRWPRCVSARPRGRRRPRCDRRALAVGADV
jgi:hypothetical protein